MNECQVIRCGARAARPIQYSPPDSVVLEGAVCEEHAARMDAGEPWAHQEEHSGLPGTGDAFLMGDDLVAAGIITNVRVGGNNATTLGDRSQPWVMRIEGERYGDGAPVDLSVALTADTARKLRRSLDLFGPPTGEQ